MDEKVLEGTPRRKESLYIDVYPESWYAVAPSASLPAGKIETLEAFSKKWVMYRTESGKLQVTGRYCPHFGASFQTGSIKGERLVCRFHGWEFESAKCVRIPYMEGGKIPPSACVASLPAMDHLGWIWVFNGRTPTFDLPDLPESRDPEYVGRYKSNLFDVHPLNILENGFDAQHFKWVHRAYFTSYEVDVLRDEPHNFEFIFRQHLALPLGRSFEIEARLHYVGATTIFGSVWIKGRQFSAFVSAMLPVSFKKTRYHEIVFPRRLPRWLFPVSPLFVRWLSDGMFRGTVEDYELIWRYQDREYGGALVAADAFQQRYHRVYRNHLPKEVQSRITLAKRPEVDAS